MIPSLQRHFDGRIGLVQVCEVESCLRCFDSNLKSRTMKSWIINLTSRTMNGAIETFLWDEQPELAVDLANTLLAEGRSELTTCGPLA